MILGILSDTHGGAATTARAVDVLRSRGAEALIHCGDVGGEYVFDELIGWRCWFVWGNTDETSAAARRYAENLGLKPPQSAPTRLTLDDKRVVIYHGHEPGFQRLARRVTFGEPLDNGGRIDNADYILFGHSHRATDRRAGRTRLVNPGALFRARTLTVATLDLSRDALDFWIVASANSNEPRRYTPGQDL